MGGGALVYGRAARSAAEAGAAKPSATSPTVPSKIFFIVTLPSFPKRFKFKPDRQIQFLRPIIIRWIGKCRLRNATVADEVKPPEANDLLGFCGNPLELLGYHETPFPRIAHRDTPAGRRPGTKLEHPNKKCYMWITRGRRGIAKLAGAGSV